MSSRVPMLITGSVDGRERKLQKPTQTKITRFFILFFGVISISTAAIFIRFAQKEADSLVIAAVRMIISAIPLIPIVLINHRIEMSRISRRNLFLSLLSGFLLALHFASWITSLEYTSIASSVVIVCTTPIWVTLFGAIVYREKVSNTTIIGITLALVGGIFVALNETCVLGFSGIVCNFGTNSNNGIHFFGNFLAFIGALMAAGYLIVGKEVRKQVSLVPYAFIVYSFSAVVLSLLVVTTRTPVTLYQPVTYLFLILLAIIPQLIGHSSLNWALKYLSTTYVSIAQMGEPIGSTILAIFIFQEIPSAIKILGALLILAGIFTVSKSSISAQSN